MARLSVLVDTPELSAAWDSVSNLSAVLMVFSFQRRAGALNSVVSGFCDPGPAI